MYPANDPVTFSIAMESISKTNHFHDGNGVVIKRVDTHYHKRIHLLMECMLI